jgi:hypothetical protein
MAGETINTRRREFLGASALVVSSALLGLPTMTTKAVASDYTPRLLGYSPPSRITLSVCLAVS